MADQDADGATTIDAARHNKLQGAYQKALSYLTPEQRAELKASRPEAAEFEAQTVETTGSQPEPQEEPARQTWAPGTMLEVGDDGELAPFEPPTPGTPNGRGSADWTGRTAEFPAKDAETRDMGRGFPTA